VTEFPAKAGMGKCVRARVPVASSITAQDGMRADRGMVVPSDEVDPVSRIVTQ
jgi:hypothetical protein